MSTTASKIQPEELSDETGDASGDQTGHAAGHGDDTGFGTLAATRDKTLADLGWSKLLGFLARRTHTERGAAAAAALPLFEQVGEALHRIAAISEARQLWALEAPMPFGGIRDVATAVARAGKGGTLDAEELLAVGTCAQGMARLRRHLDHHSEEVPLIAEEALAIIDLGHVYQPILRSFADDGTLADHASEALGPLRRKVGQLKGQIEQRIRAYVDDDRYGRHLQDRYFTTRDDRYVVPVRLEARAQVRGIVHGTSQSGRTLFVEPDAVVELQNQLRLAECDVEDEEKRILAALSVLVSRDERLLQQGLEATTALDVIDAGARLADDLNAAAPVIAGYEPGPDRDLKHVQNSDIAALQGEGAGMALMHARHPLMVLSQRPCVANDIVVECGRILVISGPNAGGKTVALKTAGLCALMTRAGLHIPAEAGSQMPWFLAVASDIGDSQSIENDLSTFSAHLVQLREFLRAANGETLLLIDEVAVGTEPEQGAALAQAVLESLAARGATAIVTTHYERLKALGASDERFANASVGFDIERMEPTFRLHLGVPGSSGALAVARRMGVDDDVLAHAEALMGERRASVEELLAAVADERRKLVSERAQLASEIEAAEVARRQAETARAAAEAQKRKMIEGAHIEAVAALRQARDELERTRADIRRQRKQSQSQNQGGSGAGLSQAKAKLSAIADAVSTHAPARPSPQGTRKPAGELHPGMAVFVSSLGGRGKIVEAPQRGRVAVQIGAMRTTVAVDDILLDTRDGGQSRSPSLGRSQGYGRQSPSRGAAKSSYSAQAAGGAAAATTTAGAGAVANEEPSVPRTSDITVDVRGERAEEAVSSVDRFIDKSLMAARDVVFVIHGHGTGALRSAVREHLQDHHSIVRWRPGLRSEGGNGVTVAWLDVG